MATGTNEWKNFEMLQERLNSRYGSRSLYDALGVNPGATEAEIRHKHREKVLRYHPDRNKAADAEQRFKDVQSIYDILSRPAKRAAYDNWLGLQGYQRETYSQASPQAAAARKRQWQDDSTKKAADLETLVKAYVYNGMPVHDFMERMRGFNLSPQQYDLVDRLLKNYFEEKRHDDSNQVEEEAARMMSEIGRIRLEALRTILKTNPAKYS